MKVAIDRDWCLNMAKLEGDGEIGAGATAAVCGELVEVGGSCDEPVLDLMARCIEPEPYVGELHDMMKLIKGMRRHGYVFVRLAEEKAER